MDEQQLSCSDLALLRAMFELLGEIGVACEMAGSEARMQGRDQLAERWEKLVVTIHDCRARAMKLL